MDSVIHIESTPVFGYSQPGSGSAERIAWRRMPTKVVSHAAKRVREALVENLSAAIQMSYPKLSASAAYQKNQRATGISLSSLQRIMSGETGPSIDTLADLAHHLGTSVPELLAPHKEALPAESGHHTPVAQRLQRRQRM